MSADKAALKMFDILNELLDADFVPEEFEQEAKIAVAEYRLAKGWV